MNIKAIQLKKFLEKSDSLYKNIMITSLRARQIIDDRFQDFTIEGPELLENIHDLQDEREKSLVFCGVKKEMLNHLNEVFGEDFFNIVPTRDEAVDMVFMEEQERELFK